MRKKNKKSHRKFQLLKLLKRLELILFFSLSLLFQRLPSALLDARRRLREEGDVVFVVFVVFDFVYFSTVSELVREDVPCDKYRR